MVITGLAGTGEVGRAFVALVVASPRAGHVRGAWARVVGSQVDFWLLTDPLDAEAEMDVREVEQALAARYPTLDFQVRVVNPRWFERLDLAVVIPADATPLALH